MSVYNWDLVTDKEIYYYVLGLGNHVVWHYGWDWSFLDFTNERVWMKDWVE